MQKLLLTFAVIFSLNASAAASVNFSLFFNDTRAMEATRKMAEAVHFNESTFIQIKHLNDAKYKELDQVAVLYNNNPAVKEAKIKEIEAACTAKIQALLNPTESAAYRNYLNTANTSLAVSK